VIFLTKKAIFSGPFLQGKKSGRKNVLETVENCSRCLNNDFFHKLFGVLAYLSTQ